MADEAEVEEELIDVLRETDLVKFQTMIVFDKQLTRIEHFQDVTDIELMSYGFSEPAVRRLRNAIDRKRKKRTKIFGATKREKTLVRLKRKPVEFGQNEAAFPSTPHLISENEILFKETLGEGHFSVVKRALWARTDGAKMDCAVKILHEMSPAIRLDLTSEISTMQRLRHQNLVQLFGVIFSEQIMMVIELCEDGSLLDRLRSQTKPRILVTTLLNYAQQIANGMGFLESRKCLHRDLATRNILLTHQEQVVKIGDFGLTRILKDNEHLYIMSEPKKIPFSWSPPESLRFREFSHKSDVWAFGVTLWELFSFGEEPWAGHRAAEVLQLIEAGHRLRMLDFCSQEIYDIMKLCWNGEAEKRPKFSHLRTLLNDCKFMTVICRVQNVATSKSQLNLSVGDELFVIGQRDNADIWYGQSAKSRNFGDFPREKVSMRSATYPQTTKNATNSPEQQKDISRPVAGSFIHTGHGDIREHKCWGHVDHIDDIYLRNPLITQNPGANSEQKVTIVPSLLMLDQKWCALSHENGVAEHLQHSDEFIDNQRLTVDQKLTDGQIFDGYDANLSIGSRNNTAGLTTNELNLQRHSTAIEWLSDGLTMSREIEPIQTQKNREQTNRQRPFALPQQKSWERNGERNETATIAKSKYDSAISIPRPNRFSNIRLTPPPISSAHFSVCRSDGCPQTVTTIFEPKMTAVSSMPSVNSPFFNNKTAPTNTKDVQMVTKVQRPNSAHSLNTEEKTQKAMRSSDDPFMVKDDVKVLASKLRYNDVHKANEFFTIGQSETNLWDERTAKESSKSNEETQKHSRSNVAIVQPFLNNQSGIEAAKGQCPPIGAVLSQHSNLTKTVESLLPPPSDLLLSGLGTSSHIRPFDPLQCQPLFDISGPCIRYGTNGIPILELAPAPMSANVDLLKCQTNGRQGKAKAEQKETVAISLNELDTDALIRRVKVSADFASFEQCRQILWRKGFDVDAAIKQLKIDKLIEMGLASDRHLAVSALDSEQWDVNAAANRLCCP